MSKGAQREEQARISAAITAIHTEHMAQRANMRAEIERMFEEKLYNTKLEKAKLMVEGLEAGISKTKLGRLIGTSDWNTVQEMLELGRRMRPEETTVNMNCRWGSHHSFGPESNVYWLEVDGDDIVQDVRDKDPNFPVYPGYMYSKIGDKPWTWVGEKPDEATQKWAEEHPPA